MVSTQSAGTGFFVSLARDQKNGDHYAILAMAWHVLNNLPGTTNDIEIVSVDRKTVFSSSASDIGFYPLLCWLGFPSITEPELCFFHGHISGYLNDPPTYLIDGVAINGVSGGPVLDNRAHVIGLVSAYIPNRVDANTTLPGPMAVVPISAIRYWMEHRLGAKVLSRSDISVKPE